MYGSVQRSAGIVPLYACAPSLMMVQISSKSWSSQRRIMGTHPSWLGISINAVLIKSSAADARIARSIYGVLNEIARDRPGSGDGRSITARGYAELADEGAGHMALVREAGPYSCLRRCLTMS